MSDDIEFEDPETATEALRATATHDPATEPLPDADATGFDDEAVSIEQDPTDRADADDRVVGVPDELSPESTPPEIFSQEDTA